MDVKYHYDHKPGRRRRRQVGLVIGLSLLVLGAIAGLVFRDISKNQDDEVIGKSQTVLQANGNPAIRFTVNEPFFTMELPGDWKEIARRKDQIESSITWQSTLANSNARSLQLYIDTIPSTLPVNRLLPVEAQGMTIMTGDISENCATFTQGGTLDVSVATKLKPAPAKWNKVDFICNLPRVIDNQVGTGSPEGINTVNVTGPTQGLHKYFFLYTEHNIQPNYEIFTSALRSFKAK